MRNLSHPSRTVFTLALILFAPVLVIPTMLIHRSFANTNPLRSTQSVQKQERSKYEYADGAGNVYIINPKSIDYRPITRAESSSGNYSGGKPRTVKIDTVQYQTISMMLDRALNLKSIHVGDGKMGRAKGTGIISKQAKNRQVQTQVIAIESLERREIEAFLDRLINERQTFGGTMN
jgi:hypothetical protein